MNAADQAEFERLEDMRAIHAPLQEDEIDWLISKLREVDKDLTEQTASHAMTVGVCHDAIESRDSLRAELTQWKQGPITEAMLRAHDGCVHLDKSVELAIAGTTAKLDAAQKCANGLLQFIAHHQWCVSLSTTSRCNCGFAKVRSDYSKIKG